MKVVIALILSLTLGLLGPVGQAVDHDHGFHGFHGGAGEQGVSMLADLADESGAPVLRAAVEDCDITCLYIALPQGELINDARPARHLMLAGAGVFSRISGFDPPPPRA